MTRLPLLLAALGASLSGTVASAASWTVDPAKSTVSFTGTAAGQSFTGRFGRFTAAIDFDPAKPEAGSAKVTVDTASATTGDAQKDELMPSADFFDVGAFPQAVFEAKHFKSLGGDKFAAEGTLTIRDKALPVTLPFTFQNSAGTAHAMGSVDLVRQSYGVGQNAWAAEDNVASAVRVDIDLVARAAP